MFRLKLFETLYLYVGPTTIFICELDEFVMVFTLTVSFTHLEGLSYFGISNIAIGL